MLRVVVMMIMMLLVVVRVGVVTLDSIVGFLVGSWRIEGTGVQR